MRLDAKLAEACSVDINKTKACQLHDPPGAQLACLKARRKSLSESCSKELFRREQEDAEDIRLNMDVFRTCQGEINTQCKDIEFGEARMLKCLWEASTGRDVNDFSESCRQKVRNLTKQTLQDYRLDFRIRTRCASDITSLCAAQQEKVDRLSIKELFASDDTQGYSEGASGQVIRCLKANYTKLKTLPCRHEVDQVIRVHAASVGANPALMRECGFDMEQFCSGIIEENIPLCLRGQMSFIRIGCKEEVLLQGTLEAMDVTLKPKLFHSCKKAMGEFCQDTTPGAGKMLQCLHEHMSKENFDGKCKARLAADLQASNHDWRLKYGISEMCKLEVESHCKQEMAQGAGTVLACLKRRYTTTGNTGCKKEMLRYVQQGVENIKFAPDVFAHCVQDVQKFCADVEPGQSRVHDCLLKHRSEISQECAAAEFANQQIITHEISASTIVMQKCALPVKKLCPNMLPVGGKVWKCLEDNLSHEDMSSGCKEEVEKHMARKHGEFYLNPGLTKYCEKDARALCADKLAAASFKDFSSEGSVITCLIANREKVKSTDCKRSLWRKEQQRAVNGSLDPVAKNQCAKDVMTYCSEARGKGKGSVQKCLRSNLEKLSEACKLKVKAGVELASEDIRFKPSMLEACALPEKRFCPDVKKGNGRIITCLLDHMHDSEMDPACKTELAKEQGWRAKSLDYNPTLKIACMRDVESFMEKNMCGSSEVMGWRINCLTRHSKEITAQECKHAVKGVLQRQSADLRAKPGMEAACASDIKTLCPDVTPGGAQLHACLREKSARITNEVCKSMVQETENVDKKSASINFAIRKNCYNEKKAFCGDIPTGQSRILACLAQHLNDDGFGDSCRKSVNKADLQTAVAKAPPVFSVEELKTWLVSHRSFVDRWGSMLLVGTVGFVIVTGFVLSYCIIQKRFFSAAYTVVVPKDLEG
mmetsp:Transcript_135047/g.341669  ORF Transcript_135047/g.341669 Transcript_135047/m.341669 type:complete len:934 (+) Transcript_135047:86-2887(+)